MGAFRGAFEGARLSYDLRVLTITGTSDAVVEADEITMTLEHNGAEYTPSEPVGLAHTWHVDFANPKLAPDIDGEPQIDGFELGPTRFQRKDTVICRGNAKLNTGEPDFTWETPLTVNLEKDPADLTTDTPPDEDGVDTGLMD